MSKIVELKSEQIENVVGGIMAATAGANPRLPVPGTTVNLPPMPAPQSNNHQPGAKR